MEESQPPQAKGDVGDWEYRMRKFRKYLLLLASLAATVTYAAGIDPPGGSWVESKGDHKAGDSILRATDYHRYLAFYYSNATAFAASLVVILLLLLVLPNKNNRPRHPIHPFASFRGRWENLDMKIAHLHVLHFVMVLDIVALMVAYTAGSFRDRVATIYTMPLVAALSVYACIHIVVGSRPRPPPTSADTALEQLRKILMLLAIFAATITYNGGLNPPGGFWEHANGLHRPGEVILKHKHGSRFEIFFFSNTAAFIASLFTVVLLLDKKLTASVTRQLLVTFYGVVVLTTLVLVALVAAYDAGSSRNTATAIYTATIMLSTVVLVSIFLAAATGCTKTKFIRWLRQRFHWPSINGGGKPDESLKEKKSLVLLLGTLAASVTYQAGLNPPGGVWRENESSSGSHGHIAGDPILSNTDEKRYSVFFYFNSIAFVASIVVILMVQIKALLKRNTLHFAMVLDLVGLMVAYIAGSSRTLRASVLLIVMAAVFLAFVLLIYLHVKIFEEEAKTNSEDPAADERRRKLKKRRKRLLLFAILMASITYQAGLSPPGGFWRVEQEGSSVGSPILEDMYPRQYQAFFYCNALSFMASIALIILLQINKTYQPAGIRFYALYGCMLLGMLALMGAYTAGSARRLTTSICVLVLVVSVIGFIAALRFALFLRQPQLATSATTTVVGACANANCAGTVDDQNRRRRKHMMLLAVLAASVTYQAGLDPPGGVWPDGYAAGSPVLLDSNLRRYLVFFYSNSSSFVASIIIMIPLLRSELRNNMPPSDHDDGQHDEDPILLVATNTVVALDLVGLLVAYAAGSSRTMNTSLYVIALVVVVVICIVVVGCVMPYVNPRHGEGTSNPQGANDERRNGAK